MKKRDKVVMICGCVILFVVVITILVTYAFFNNAQTQSNNNVAAAGCFNVAFSEKSEGINLSNTLPVTDEVGQTKDSYTFELNNTCDYTAEYNVRIEVLNVSTLSEDYIKTSIDGYIPVMVSDLDEANNPIANNVSKVYVLYTGLLGSGNVVEHDVRHWLDENATEAQASNKAFRSKITIEAVATDKVVPVKLSSAILAQDGGSSAIEAKGEPSFNAVPTALTSGIYATEDEYGTSYYYRGERNSLNNNLIFAGFQWKIVRINGDGSVRLIYNGTEAQYNSISTMNTTGTNTQIGTSAFNTSYNDNKYMGYMYGGTNGTASTSLVQAQTNETNSTIKTYLDAWYVNNIGTQNFAIRNMIADNLFCNDRQLGRDYPGAPTTGIGWDGTGSGTSRTYYATYYKHMINASNPVPTLKCAQKNDRFTVSDISIGNGALTYPVGLISADEITYGGTTNAYYNEHQYLSTSQDFWVMSSDHYYSNSVYVWGVFSDDYLSVIYPDYGSGVRPILNLRPDVVVTSGNGSSTNPFVLQIDSI